MKNFKPTSDRIAAKALLTPEQKEANKLARKEANKQIKELARIEAEKNQPEVKEMTITIEWCKSKTWGANPHAHAEIHYKDNKAGAYGTGFYRPDTDYTCSGCGYDKESTVIAQIFNEFMKGKLWSMGIENLKGGNGSGDKGNAPYGIHLSSNNRPYFGDAIGTSCYYRIAEFLGGKFEHIANGKTFDVYKYTEGC
jgi:hypothetical protein